MRPRCAAATLAVLILLSSEWLCVAQLGDSIIAFVGFNGTCDSPRLGSARLYAARADMDAAVSRGSLSWIVSSPAPLDIPPPAVACQWHIRPAVDPTTNRLWYFVGVCAASGTPPSNIVVSEWDVGSGDAPPKYLRACTFDASSIGLDYVAYDSRVFAPGPYVINTTAGAADGRARVFGIAFLAPAPGGVPAVLPSCALTAIAQLDPAVNVTGVFTADASANPELPPVLLHTPAGAGMYSTETNITVSALSPTSGELQWQSNISVALDQNLHADGVASLGLFDRRFVALIEADDGRFMHSSSVQGWAANSSPATSVLMDNIVSGTNSPSVCLAVTAWAPGAAAGKDYPLYVFYLSGENDGFQRGDWCRSSGVTLGPAFVYGFLEALYPGNRTQLLTSGCPLADTENCAFLSYAHGRPLIATMQGTTRSGWGAGL